MKVVLTIAGLSPEFGGPSRSVPALAEALAREKIEVDLIACESLPGHGGPMLADANLVRSRLLPIRSRLGRWRATSNDFFRAVCHIGGAADTVIHDNGLWLPTNHAVAKAASYLKRPLVISVRGMLNAWEREHHAWKKRAAWILFQRRDLLAASVLHATSEQEMKYFRRAGLRGPIAMVPNGVDLPSLNKPELHDRARTVLCITRIHPKKNLMSLVEAWSEARPNGWRMIIAGSSEDGHREELEAAIAVRGLSDEFEFVGPVDTQERQTLYDKAGLFVLPSYSENFGMSVAEALANGVPVITTRGAPWQDLISHGCGWWEEIGAAPLARALRKAVAMTDDERLEMGRRGRELVEQKYLWQRVAREMKSVYGWLLGQEERPECVVLD